MDLVARYSTHRDRHRLRRHLDVPHRRDAPTASSSRAATRSAPCRSRPSTQKARKSLAHVRTPPRLAARLARTEEKSACEAGRGAAAISPQGSSGRLARAVRARDRRDPRARRLSPHRLAPACAAADALFALAGVVLGALGADLVTGVVHWACDTWGDERTRWVGAGLIRAFREHHDDPRAMLEHDWIEVNGEPAAAASAASALLALPPVQDVARRPRVPRRVRVVARRDGVAREPDPSVVARPRAAALGAARSSAPGILSPARHARHHRARTTATTASRAAGSTGRSTRRDSGARSSAR